MSVVGQSHLGETSQAVGTSISVGMRIFSIVGGLGFVSGQCRGFGRWQPVMRALHLPRMLRMLGGAWGRLRSWWSLVGGFTGRGR